MLKAAQSGTNRFFVFRRLHWEQGSFAVLVSENDEIILKIQTCSCFLLLI
jgi:predicted nucleic acid-binding Zn finger protein